MASDATNVFAFDDDFSMGILVSRTHGAWVDEGAWVDLKDLHRELDVAVADCYGWPAAVAQDDREISEGRREYSPFG